MVNKPLIRPYFLVGVALGGVARIPMTILYNLSIVGMLSNMKHGDLSNIFRTHLDPILPGEK